MIRARAEGGAVGNKLGGASSTGWPRRWRSNPQASHGPPPRVDASTDGACLALRGSGPTPPAGGLPPVLRGCGGQYRPAGPGSGGGRLRGPSDLLREACSRLGIAPVRDAFATATDCRYPAFWSKAEDAFAKAWDYPSAGPFWENPPFSRLDEVVTKASREVSLILIVAPEWGGLGYPWWAALCALCPMRWCFTEGRPVYLRGGTELMPAPRWRTWAFLLDSRPLLVPGPPAVPPAVGAALTLTNPPLCR